MKTIYSLILVLVFAFTILAQSDLPIIGKISEIQGKKRVYIAAESTDSRKKIQKVLEKDKSFEIVTDTSLVEFVITYKQLSKNARQGIHSAGKNEDIGEMTAYFMNSDKIKVIAWSETKNAYEKTGWGGMKANEEYLTETFLKQYKESTSLTIGRPNAAPTQFIIDDGIKTLNGGVINGKAIKLEKPAYPKEARKDKASGIINVEVVIDTDGKILTANAISSGHPALKAAAEEAARKSLFSPSTLNGEKVRIRGVLIYNFVAQ